MQSRGVCETLAILQKKTQPRLEMVVIQDESEGKDEEAKGLVESFPLIFPSQHFLMFSVVKQIFC